MTNGSVNHEFDFWIGKWDVTWGEGKHGTNQIERILDGAVIRENFEGDGLIGIRVSVFSAEDDRWHQTWVDNSGGYLDFVGGFSGGKMILSRNGIARGKPVKQRMIWYDIEQNQFQWNWERSEDDGKTWQVLWNIQYQRRVAAKT